MPRSIIAVRFPSSAARALRRLALAAIASTVPSAAQAVDPQFASWCQQNTEEAVAQAAKNRQLNCGFEGDLWAFNRDDYFNWCIAQDGAYAEPTQQSLYRIAGLKDCEAKVEAAKTRLPGDGFSTANADVDIYNEPGGDGTVVGVLEIGTKVLAECQTDNWCLVTQLIGQAGVPRGWVWGEFLDPPR